MCQDGNAARRAANVLSATLSCSCKRDVEGMDEMDVNLSTGRTLPFKLAIKEAVGRLQRQRLKTFSAFAAAEL